MKEFFRNAIETIKDNRFSWKFKLCNIITNDWLRWYMASIMIASANIRDNIMIFNSTPENCDSSNMSGYKHFVKWSDMQTKKIQEAVHDVWEM